MFRKFAVSSIGLQVHSMEALDDLSRALGRKIQANEPHEVKTVFLAPHRQRSRLPSRYGKEEPCCLAGPGTRSETFCERKTARHSRPGHRLARTAAGARAVATQPV